LFTLKPGKKIYHCVGRTVRYSEAGVFRNVALPGSGVMRLMEKGVYKAAIESAGQKLRELGRRSGKKEPAKSSGSLEEDRGRKSPAL